MNSDAILHSKEANPVRGWLLDAAERGASDLHLIGAYPPVLRRHGAKGVRPL